MAKKNYSSVLFDEIEKQRKVNIRSHAKNVARALTDAEARVEAAKSALKDCLKSRKKIRKALKKFKESGDLRDLSALGIVINIGADPEIPF